MKKRLLFLFAGAALLIVAATLVPVVVLRWVPPPASAFIVQKWWISKFSDQGPSNIDYEWVPMEKISPYVPLAVVAAEDQKFLYHNGFDFDAIEAAYEHNQKSKRTRGASTISQQVAKNLFLWPGRSYLRKGLEVYFTVLIEAMWPKERILEVYVNIAEMGNGTFGVSAASRKFFHKSPSKINASEAALLAAVLPNPVRFRVDRPSRYVQSRQRHILSQMHKLGFQYLNTLKN